MASLTATVSASSTAQATIARVSSAVPGWTTVTPGMAASSEASRRLWCDLPGPAGIRPA